MRWISGENITFLNVVIFYGAILEEDVMFKVNIIRVALGIVLVLFISASHALLPPKIWRCREANLKPGAKLQGCDFRKTRFDTLAAGRPDGLVDLTEANISGADFTGNAHVEKVIFNKVNGKNAKFNKAKIGNSFFINAQLPTTEFGAASLDNDNFNGANLNDALFAQAKIKRSAFNGAKLVSVNFSRANISSDTKFRNVEVSKSNFGGATFSGFNNLTFSSSTIKDSSLFKTTFICQDIIKTDYPIFQILIQFNKATEGISFIRCNVSNFNFIKKNLNGSDFTGSSLNFTVFIGSILTNTKFKFADLTGANLRAKNISGADFENSNLKSASVLNGEDWWAAKYSGADFSFARAADGKICPEKSIGGCPELGIPRQ